MADYVIAPGAEAVIDASTVIDPHYNALFIGDGATLRLNRRTVTFNVGECRIANNVRILGAGQNAPDAPHAKSDKVQAGYGHTGYDGDAGPHGPRGSPGNDIHIVAGLLHALGTNIQVDLRGGDGGSGGNGGDAGMGGNAVCPPIMQRAGNGGIGGNGGDGAPGQPGGLFELRYTSYQGPASAPVPNPSSPNFLFQVDGGTGGFGGNPGQGGRGGDGAECLIGAMGGGNRGADGHRGRNAGKGERRPPIVRATG